MSSIQNFPPIQLRPEYLIDRLMMIGDESIQRMDAPIVIPSGCAIQHPLFGGGFVGIPEYLIRGGA